jgi:hypothetical protein
MRIITRTIIILSVGLLVAAAVWAVADTAWAGSAAAAVISGNQTSMDASYGAGTTGDIVRPSGDYIATTGNLVKMAGIGGIVIAVSLLLERRKKRPPMPAR